MDKLLSGIKRLPEENSSIEDSAGVDHAEDEIGDKSESVSSTPCTTTSKTPNFDNVSNICNYMVSMLQNNVFQQGIIYFKYLLIDNTFSIFLEYIRFTPDSQQFSSCIIRSSSYARKLSDSKKRKKILEKLLKILRV